MATLEKLKRRNAAGKVTKSDRWYVQYSFGGKRKRVSAWTNKEASKQLAANIEKLKSCRESGIPPSKHLMEAIDHLDERILNHLKNAGLLDSSQTTGANLLSDHLSAWVANELGAKENTERHIQQRAGRARRLLKAAGARWWSDVDAGRVQRALRHMKETEGLSMSTVMHTWLH